MNVAIQLFGYGGIEPTAHDAIFGEFTHAANSDITWAHRVVYDDALIERARSVNMSRALHSKADVIVQIDHDIQWVPGDVGALARKALAENAIVGGLYPCRSYQRGFSSRLQTQAVKWTTGGEKLHPAEYVATGFMAVSKRAVERIIAVCMHPDASPEMKVTECIGVERAEESFWDLFRCMTTPCTLPGSEGKNENLSEDWSFCARARFAEVPLFLYERPLLRHWGRYGFTFNDGIRK